MLFRILFGEGDVEISADVLDVEGRVAIWKSLVLKPILHFMHVVKGRVENLDAPLVKISNIEKSGRGSPGWVCGCNRDSLEHGPALFIYLDYGAGRIHSWIPSRYSAVFGDEDE